LKASDDFLSLPGPRLKSVFYTKTSLVLAPSLDRTIKACVPHRTLTEPQAQSQSPSLLVKVYWPLLLKKKP